MLSVKVLRYISVVPASVLAWVLFYYIFHYSAPYLLSEPGYLEPNLIEASKTMYHMFCGILFVSVSYWMAPEKKMIASSITTIIFILFVLFAYNSMADLGFWEQAGIFGKGWRIYLVLMTWLVIFGAYKTRLSKEQARNKQELEELRIELDDLGNKFEAMSNDMDPLDNVEDLSKDSKLSRKHELLRMKGLYRALQKNTRSKKR